MPKRLNQEFIKRAKSDDDLKYELKKANGCVVSTVERWLRENDVILTTADNLEIFRKHFGLIETAELLEEVELFTTI